MSKNRSTDNDGKLDTNTSDDYDDEYDLITLQLESQNINFYYTHLSKYSLLIRKDYIYSDVKNELPTKIQEYQENYKINPSNFILFFQLLQANFNINQSLTLSYQQYRDLYKISELLQVKKLRKNLDNYFSSHNEDVEFIIQLILYESEEANQSFDFQSLLTAQMEQLLTTEIARCIQNETFSKLPIPLIYRVIEKSDKKKIKSDILYSFIKKSIDKFYLLFSFLDLQSLSDENFQDLYAMYTSNESSNKACFQCLQCNLDYIAELKKKNGDFQVQINQLESSENKLKSQLNDANSDVLQLQSQLGDAVKDKNRLQCQLEDVEKEKMHLEDQLSDAEKEKSILKSQLDDAEKEKSILKSQLDDAGKEKEMLQRKVDRLVQDVERLKKKIKLEGTIVASASKDTIKVRIEFSETELEIDKTQCKCVISKSKAPKLGIDAYKDGKSIDSNPTNLEFKGKHGTCYCRAFVVDNNGNSYEFISNAVTIKMPVMRFEFEGRVKQITLDEGIYKLEVWGAQGGDSVGEGNRPSDAKGGLGGYSVGTITLTKPTVLFVRVGGRGRSCDSADGSSSEGGFPDGGGAKTGHDSPWTTVPGTGGGSTSISVLEDSLYSRVIVAGGGGGASGNNFYVDHGGFGGGTNGGCCYFKNSLQKVGCGTQTGSSAGLGTGCNGNAGKFRKGASGLYKHGCDSGGGGGGGWYGGGSGGYGNVTNCSGGGGGSGWVFTEQSLSVWRSGNPSDAHNFRLGTSLYLTSASTYGGNKKFPNPQGNGEETGHSGDGFAKITPL